MREIKFRAWDKEAKEMFPDTHFAIFNGTPYPLETANELYELWESAKEKNGNRLSFETSVDRFMANFITSDWAFIDFANWKGIDDYELMQCTGLKDKNEVEIYEGDIVKVENDPYVLTVCKWETGGFVLEDKAHGQWTRQLYHQTERLDVIGNIHENPELLS